MMAYDQELADERRKALTRARELLGSRDVAGLADALERIAKQRDEARHGRQIHVEASEVLTRRLRESRQQADALADYADKLREALESGAEAVCSLLCPSTWRTDEGRPPHSKKCQQIQAALALPVPPSGPHQDTEFLAWLRKTAPETMAMWAENYRRAKEGE